MTELRRDPATGTWLIVAPHRASVPHPTDQLTCPFCPGHEAATPPELARVPDAAGRWAVRVVANKYPLAGTHEVVIESPDHTWNMTGHRQVGRVLGMWRERYRAHCATHEIVVIFRNHNPTAGASQPHPHSQIVALPAVPPDLDRHHPRVASLHAVLDSERSEHKRLICESDRFTAFVPYAGEAYESWIVPHAAHGTFADLIDEDLRDLAVMLPRILGALRRARGDPPYNLMIHSGRCGDSDERPRWYLQILPRLATPGGFEIATGIRVSTIEPEAAATELRQHLRSGHPG